MHDMRVWLRLFESAEPEQIDEVAPEGWEGTVKAMKKEKDIDNPWALCLAGDTKIPLLDGRTLTMAELVTEYGDGTPFWVYSFDIDHVKTPSNKADRRNGFFAPGLAHHPRCTGEQETLKITLDNGEVINCSRGHPFLLRDNTYKAAENLSVGDALRPLNLRLDERGYREFDCGYSKWHKVHLHVYGYSNLVQRNEKGQIKFRWTVHHRDFRKLNNRPDNLQKMTMKEHQLLHAALGKPENWVHVQEWRNNNPELWHKQCVANGHKASTNPQSREALRAYTSSDACKENGRANLVAYNQSEEHREAVRERMKNSPEHVTHMQEAARIPEARAKQAATMREWHSANVEKSIATVAAMQAALSKNDMSRNAKWGRHLYWHDRRGIINHNCDYCVEGYSNHKIVAIEPGPVMMLYDLSVDKYHNFALAAGVYVHNSHWMKNKGYHSHKKESMAFIRDLSGAQLLAEKWDTDYETPKSKQGMWDGWSKTDLEAERNKLRDKEERTDAESTRLKQVNFALRAKSNWGDVPD